VRVLVINAGSSSLKVRVLGHTDEVLYTEDLAAQRGVFARAELEGVLASIEPLFDAVGHRIVHGGTRFTGPTLLTSQVEDSLRELIQLAPLHQATSLAALDLVRQAIGARPEVACFDTAFHASLPPEASTYAVPADWRDRLGVRRFGFHGLSHAYAGRRAAEVLERPIEELRIASCHLGSGASVTAILSGRSVDTTMGFTPLEGLVMATRSGSIDPGLVLWLLQQPGFEVDGVLHALESESGLRALAGTPDMAEVVGRARGGDPDAGLALAVYVQRVKAAIAAMAASMAGIDALSFTGGIGENAATVRRLVGSGLGFLGVQIDDRLNASAEPDLDVSAGGSIPVLVLRAREDLQIAAEVRSVLSEPRGE
jgi:acetate kinase